jgi:hypothetical protein
MSRGHIGGHSQPGLIRPTADSDPYGLCNVLRHGDDSERTEFPLQREWDAGSDNPRSEFGLVQHDNTADASVLSEIPQSGHQRWDRDYPGPGVTQPAQPGPAIAALQVRRGKTS